MAVMHIQPITYRGRTVAACTRERFFLADELESRPPDNPELTFVLFICTYAGDVLRGDMPCPYTDENTRQYTTFDAGLLCRSRCAPRRRRATRQIAPRTARKAGDEQLWCVMSEIPRMFKVGVV
jgi:hypothetical protein